MMSTEDVTRGEDINDSINTGHYSENNGRDGEGSDQENITSNVINDTTVEDDNSNIIAEGNEEQVETSNSDEKEERTETEDESAQQDVEVPVIPTIRRVDLSLMINPPNSH